MKAKPRQASWHAFAQPDCGGLKTDSVYGSGYNADCLASAVFVTVIVVPDRIEVRSATFKSLKTIAKVPVICVIVTAELLWIYTGSVSMQISMDKLTQVNNRQNLMGFLNYKIRNHSDSVLLMMLDVDNFKTINDTHGHPEGDQALVSAAQQIISARLSPAGAEETAPRIPSYSYA